jgi:hypothetical protein
LLNFAARMQDRMDWNASPGGIQSVSSELRQTYAIDLGRVITRVVDFESRANVDGLSISFEDISSEGDE